MNLDRIRNIEVLELADQFDPAIANVSIELANWLNATLSFSLIKNVIDKGVAGGFGKWMGKDAEASEVHARKMRLDQIQQELLSLPLELGFDFLTLEDQTDIQNWLSQSSTDFLIISGFLKDQSFGWKASLVSHIHQQTNAVIGVAPSNLENSNFHVLIVPYHFDSLSNEKLEILRWFAEQMGLLIEFVHFVTGHEQDKGFNLSEHSEKAMDQIEQYFNNNLVKFYFPSSSNLNKGLQTFLKHRKNYIIAFMDDYCKNAYFGKSFSQDKLEPFDALTILI